MQRDRPGVRVARAIRSTMARTLICIHGGLEGLTRQQGTPRDWMAAPLRLDQ